MAKVYMVSADVVKSDTLIGDATDSKFINPAILTNQDIVIQAYLGTALYEKILADIEAGSVGGAYLTLLQTYIRKTLVWHAAADAVLAASIQATNKGVQQKSGENSTGVSSGQYRLVVEDYRNKGEFYGQRLIKYLCENSASFPEYSQSTEYDIKPERTSYKTGMFLGSPRTKRGWPYNNYDNEF